MNASDDDAPPDRTVDPEPQTVNIDDVTDEEALLHMAWLKRNFDAIAARGVECPFDDDEPPAAA